MKVLNTWQNAIFRIGAIALVIGLGLRLFMPIPGTIMYALGILGFATMQMLAEYEGTSIVIIRLRRQQVMSDLLFLLSAAAMVSQEFNFGPSWAHRNLWTLLLIIGCVLQLYTAFRIPSEIEKDEHKHKAGGMTPLLLFLLAFLTQACQTQYHIEGTTNLTMLEGKTLQLNTFKVDSMITLDSCRIQHGRIMFSGKLDSAMMANIFVEGQSLMPLVLEEGEIFLTIDDVKQEATGTPLNDTLAEFIRAKVHIDYELSELPRVETKMIMDGVDEMERNNFLISESERLLAQNDRLVTTFIVRHSDNVLGPGVFMIMTSGLPFPQLTPQIEEILFRAKPYFKEHPYVRRYIEVARTNMEKIHTGTTK